MWPICQWANMAISENGQFFDNLEQNLKGIYPQNFFNIIKIQYFI